MILGRPDITKEMGSRRFREFFYTEEELKDFCGKNGLSAEGSRGDLVDRVAAFLDGKKGPVEKFVLKSSLTEQGAREITDDTPIEEGLQYGQRHTQYFSARIGAEYEASEDFIQWLELNAGKPYKAAVEIWYLMAEDNVGHEAADAEAEEPVAEPAAEPVAEPAAEPMAEPAAEPMAEPAAEPMPEPTDTE